MHSITTVEKELLGFTIHSGYYYHFTVGYVVIRQYTYF